MSVTASFSLSPFLLFYLKAPPISRFGVITHTGSCNFPQDFSTIRNIIPPSLSRLSHRPPLSQHTACVTYLEYKVGLIFNSQNRTNIQKTDRWNLDDIPLEYLDCFCLESMTLLSWHKLSSRYLLLWGQLCQPRPAGGWTEAGISATPPDSHGPTPWASLYEHWSQLITLMTHQTSDHPEPHVNWDVRL